MRISLGFPPYVVRLATDGYYFNSRSKTGLGYTSGKSLLFDAKFYWSWRKAWADREWAARVDMGQCGGMWDII